MRKHRCPGGVKVARFPGMSEVSGSIPVSRLSSLSLTLLSIDLYCVIHLC